MRFVGSFFLSVKAMDPGIGLCFRAGVLCIGMIWLSGCALTTARSSTLSAISNPAAPHHTDYLEYQQGRLTKAQLMDRLPHIAIVGDSLSRDFYVSSLPSCVWRSKMNHRCDWFLDTDPFADSIYSVYERLAQETPLVACEYSSVGGRVDSGGGRNRFLGSWLPLSFSQQVDLILEEKRFPDLVLLWIGHNNLHWEWFVDPRQPEEIETGLQKMAANFRQDYERQLGRLVERAQEQKQRRAFIIFGLVNFKSFFEARDAAEQLRKENPELYPYFEVDYKHYETMKPEYRGNMMKLALMINEELRAMVGEFNRELGGNSQVRLEYSDALATADLSDVKCIHRIDAWHPSVKGHNVLAAAAFGALGPSLNFLGIVPLQKNAAAK
ncbi:MAG: SGNH/GDSL hydrolase family protein [Syntrophobacterales bacterium]|jgi:lysophospholipase L1-like esterase|nr:SGNH/GDSL hydrolase family protein [Syntrophobacterales bacterium]